MSAEKHKNFTVAELLYFLTEKLKEEPGLGDHTVILAGCDCVGRWDGTMDTPSTEPGLNYLFEVEKRKEVILQRSDR